MHESTSFSATNSLFLSSRGAKICFILQISCFSSPVQSLQAWLRLFPKENGFSMKHWANIATYFKPVQICLWFFSRMKFLPSASNFENCAKFLVVIHVNGHILLYASFQSHFEMKFFSLLVCRDLLNNVLTRTFCSLLKFLSGGEYS